MIITEQTNTRLVFTQQKNEGRIISVVGASIFLGLGLFACIADSEKYLMLVYGFGGFGVFFAALFFVKPAATQLILDQEVGELVLRVAKPGGRRVTTVPLEGISDVRLIKGDVGEYRYQQVQFAMREGSDHSPVKLPVGITGMSHADIHATIERWSEQNSAFGPARIPEPND